MKNHVTVDHAALIRGYTRPGETCEIHGIGPIPVASAKAMLNDACLSIIVKQSRRHKWGLPCRPAYPAKLRTAPERPDDGTAVKRLVPA